MARAVDRRSPSYRGMWSFPLPVFFFFFFFSLTCEERASKIEAYLLFSLLLALLTRMTITQMTSRSKLNRIKGEERKFLLQNLLSRANWYFWISNFSVLTTVNSSRLKVNLVHLISLKFCSIWPEKELSSSLERCESDEMFVAVSMLQDLGALASSEPFSCTRSLIRVRP